MFVESVTLILSVLTMLWRDVRKLVTSLMRMLMYFSPVIWECHFAASVPFHNILNIIMKLNPVYYIVNGYRDCIFYNRWIFAHPGTDDLFLGSNDCLICNWLYADVISLNVSSLT